jgi:hypothetical protein
MFTLEYSNWENPNENDRELEEQRMKLLSQKQTPESIARILEIEATLWMPTSEYINQDR